MKRSELLFGVISFVYFLNVSGPHCSHILTKHPYIDILRVGVSERIQENIS